MKVMNSSSVASTPTIWNGSALVTFQMSNAGASGWCVEIR
jgi:hypothetical protein